MGSSGSLAGLCCTGRRGNEDATERKSRYLTQFQAMADTELQETRFQLSVKSRGKQTGSSHTTTVHAVQLLLWKPGG